jgi:hypothetical protein
VAEAPDTAEAEAPEAKAQTAEAEAPEAPAEQQADAEGEPAAANEPVEEKA